MKNFILSPRGENLMILKASRGDAGTYACVARNAAGEDEAPFTVAVLTPPHIDEAIDQNPRVVQHDRLILHCPVLGYPEPEVTWSKDGGLPFVFPDSEDRYELLNGQDLVIVKPTVRKIGRKECFREPTRVDTPAVDRMLPESSTQTSVLRSSVRSLEWLKTITLGPPKFRREGETTYEVVEGDTITLDCGVEADPAPEVIWMRGDQKLYLAPNMALSPDGMVILTLSRSFELYFRN